ncbi:hypothetical protein G9C85_16225 [Halorubellus sp. JP-L1]|uniref:DUF7344 domain-containing protein n=1 Tax=Halorubellus sp. JP-L1 TaxID=2715753 RepID=UPI00140AED81|nr:hypothetical protein [Halorubellus sp. JP-L1]NHN43166.1 hypothetical protein [Halorubellus sp. JP-L1]
MTESTNHDPNEGDIQGRTTTGSLHRPTTTTPLAGQSADANLPLETVFDVLRNERRQHVLAYVAVGDEEPAKIGDLAEHIAAIENGVPVNRLSSQQRKRVYVALYQCHLPKMANADIVDFDKDRGTVRDGENLDQIRPYLDVTDTDENSPMPVHYLAFTGAAVLAYVLSVLVAPGGALAGGIVLFAAIVAVLAVEYRSPDS